MIKGLLILIFISLSIWAQETLEELLYQLEWVH